MSFNDFVLISGGSIIGWLAAFLVLAVVYFLLVDWFDDEDTQSWFKLIMAGIALAMLASMVYSFIKTQYVHTERTTIDRSVGDAAQRELQEQVEQGEVN